jgi:hypothetical protein
MAYASVSVNIWFPSIINVWVDWCDFSVAYWRWLEEGSFRCPAPPLIQHGRYSSHLGFGYHWLSDERLRRLVRFFRGSLGGSSIFTMLHFSLNLIFHTPTDNFPLGGMCHALRCPCLQIFSHPNLSFWGNVHWCKFSGNNRKSGNLGCKKNFVSSFVYFSVGHYWLCKWCPNSIFHAVLFGEFQWLPGVKALTFPMSQSATSGSLPRVCVCRSGTVR